jgi:hypothetical protein
VADPGTSLASIADFKTGPFADLASALEPQALEEFLLEGTRLCEDETERRLAPFTITETLRASALDPDEYAESANIPMDIQGTLGLSYATTLGAVTLVRHAWLHEHPPRYQDMWAYSDLTVEIIRSYGGSETLIPSQILDGPDDTGHLWFQLGQFIPVGSRVRCTYSGGYTIAVPSPLVRANKLLTAEIIVRELNPDDAPTSHDPGLLHDDALMILSNWMRA